MEIGSTSQKQGGVISYSFNFNKVPEGCITSIFALTSPVDVCRLAPVSTAFRSASESDIIWERFLPSDCNLIVARSEDGESLFDEFPMKKQLYMRLADRPLLIDGATKSFWLDKPSGSKCLMLGARSISIIWGDAPRYWTWTSLPESRFQEVAQLLNVCWLEIRGKIKTSTLSPKTLYAAYLVFKMSEGAKRLDIVCETSLGIAGGETERGRGFLTPYDELFRLNRTPSRGFLGFGRPSDRGRRADQFPNPRPDGWHELKIGEFFSHVGEEDLVEMSVMEIDTGSWKRGLIVEGIEVRPARTGQ